MARYAGRRLLEAIPLILIVATFVFVLARIIPGDPVALILGDEATSADVARVRAQLGLDRPLVVQYALWLSRAVLRLDLGESFYLKQPVGQAIVQRIEPTFLLAASGALLAIVMGMALGVVAAVRRNTLVDRAVMVVALAGLSVPSFLVGLILILVFAVRLRLLPSSGYAPLHDGWPATLRYLVLPAITIGVGGAGIIARITRSSMLDVLRAPYVQTARSKGLPRHLVILKHALRNALIPTMTVISLTIAGLVAGTIIVETVFAIPGSGRLVVQSVARRDYPVIQGAVMFVALLYVLVNAAVDVLYAYLDPRIRYD
ncbi:MAG TPA: ABC transporter permease [bacterium]|nr:ABC transporter permease [bacterium]